MKYRVLLILLVALGAAVFIICGFFALQDWSALRAAYTQYHALCAGEADLRALSIAYQAQSIHRTNLYAEGVWALLGAILAAIALRGLRPLDMRPPK